ncbi:MAG: hypothetical protein EHM58_16400 [Ignavibacteriae bacterium]|nr:MAG: hypothetical protein EHM58_16400 [Ignavibacteriota bacterium]
MKNKFYVLASFLIVFSSCVSNDFKVMQPSGNNPGVVMESKMRRGLFGASGGFELKFINLSQNDMKNCQLKFNDKYQYTLMGLHSRDKGVIKKDTFAKGDTLIIPFTEEVDNFIFFNVPKDGFKTEKVRLTCSECDVEWKIE